MCSKAYLELQAQIKADQQKINDLTEFIVRFEQNFKGSEAITLRTVKASYINKVKAAQTELDMMSQRDDVLPLYPCG